MTSSRLRVPTRLLWLVLLIAAVWLGCAVGYGWLGRRSPTVLGGMPPASPIATPDAGVGPIVEPLAPAPSPDAPLAELAAWIRPRPAEESWLRIPWRGSLRQAQSLAHETHRLVFLWGTNQPIGRC